MLKKYVLSRVIMPGAVAIGICVLGSQMAFAKTGGANGPGNGGDGLELASPSDGGVSVVVPVPFNTGTLLVTGTPGAGQNTYLEVQYCTSDVNGQPLQYGCSGSQASGSNGNQTYTINQSITLDAGVYEISYSGLTEFTQVKAGQQTEIDLKEIQVGSSSQSAVSFTVFADLTDPSMQNNVLLQYFANTPQSLIQAECTSPAAVDVSDCNAWMSGNYQRLSGSDVEFASDGSYSLWRFSTSQKANDGSYFKETPLFVDTSQSGPFVSVFPGVYGIQFTDNMTGQTQTQLGVKAE